MVCGGSAWFQDVTTVLIRLFANNTFKKQEKINIFTAEVGRRECCWMNDVTCLFVAKVYAVLSQDQHVFEGDGCRDCFDVTHAYISVSSLNV